MTQPPEADGSFKVILVGGTSHTGKSTFAQRLADRLGWQYLSTDMFARHPGRPWRDQGQLPADVSAYYRSGSPQDLAGNVLQHYQHNVWPIAAAMIRARLANTYDAPLVLEGSALLPELVADLPSKGVSAQWLTAPADSIAERIRASSTLAGRSAAEQELIAQFLGRSLIVQEQIEAAAALCGFQLVDVSLPGSLQHLADDLVARATAGPG